MNRPMTIAEAVTLAQTWAKQDIPSGPVGLSWDHAAGKIHKRPATGGGGGQGGFKRFSTDPDKVRRMFNGATLRKGEEMGVGLWPGPAGLLVLDPDIDPKTGDKIGVDTLAKLEAEHGALPPHPIVRTASGGEHHTLPKRPGTRVGNHDFGDHIEVRSDAGYVVAPGTFCTWGEWKRSPASGPMPTHEQVPDWVYERLNGSTSNGGSSGVTGHWGRLDPEQLRPADRAALEALLRLGGHDPYTANRGDQQYVAIARPGKHAAGCSVGFIGPGVAKMYHRDWWPLRQGATYDADRLIEIADAVEAGDRQQAERLADPNYDTDRLIGDRNGGEAGDDSSLDPSSWAPVDLTDALAGTDIDPPAYFKRSDGLHLIYTGRVHWFQGESESCKSWAAQLVVADQLKAGNDVLYLDFEDDERGVTARLKALGVPAEMVKAHLSYHRPDEALMDPRGERYNAAAWKDLQAILEHTYTLAVIDGVTEAMTTEGLKMLDNTDIARWMRLLPKRIAAKTGAATCCIDHLTKDRDGQGRYAIGGQHKLAGVTGATYKFTTLRPFARCSSSDPVEGVIAVTVEKDRPGYVKGRAIDQHKVGTLTLTAYPDGGVTTSLDPPGQASEVSWAVVRRIVEHLSTYDGATKNAIETSVEGKNEAKRSSLRWMAENGYVEIERVGQSYRHWLTHKGRVEGGEV